MGFRLWHADFRAIGGSACADQVIPAGGQRVASSALIRPAGGLCPFPG